MGFPWNENESASEFYSKLNIVLQKYIAADEREKDSKQFLLAELKKRAPSKYKVYINDYIRRKTEAGKEHDINDFMKGIAVHEKLLKEQPRWSNKNSSLNEALTATGKQRKKGKEVTCY